MTIQARPSRHGYSDLVDIKERSFRVHSSLYTDAAIFERELVEIFEKTWVYVGHESEIAEPGDYKTSQIGRYPIIVTRDKDGEIHALLNVCRHRANAICRESYGNSQNFRCPYHAWTYRNSGELIGVPDGGRYPQGFSTRGLGLQSVAHVGAYRGLIFASLSEDVPALEDHLSHLKVHIELWADRSIGGEHRVLRPHRYAYLGNWKFQCENGVDGYHPGIVHESAFSTFGEFGIGNFSARDLVKRGHITRGFPGGHSTLEGGVLDGRGVGRGLPARFEEYFARQKEVHGDERAEEIISNRHVFIFPNVFLFDELVRVIQPLALEYTEVYSHPFWLNGVPDDLNTRRLYEGTRQLSTTGMVNPSDLEMFAANQTGLHSRIDWLVLDRGMDDERVDADGVRTGNYSDEVPQRSFYRHWVEAMGKAGAGR